MAYTRFFPNCFPSIQFHIDGITVGSWNFRISRLLYNMREFAIGLNIDSDQNYRRQPTYTFSFITRPCECEKKAAHIRNQALTSIETQNIVEVAYRYIQSRDLGIYYLNLSAYNGAMTVFSGYVAYSVGLFKWSHTYPYTIAFPAYAVVEARNTIRYKRTENACEKFLKEIDEKMFCSIQQFQYNKDGIQKLQLFFTSRGKEVKFLEEKEKRLEEIGVKSGYRS